VLVDKIQAYKHGSVVWLTRR